MLSYTAKIIKQEETGMKKVKKRWLLCTVVMCMCLYTGCQKQNAVQEASFKPVTKVIEGYQMADGSEVPVKVTLELKNVQKGEEAYKRLSGENASIVKPEEDMEYIIAKGESEQGSVAFLHKKDSIEPLYFVGFSNTADFDID